MVTVSNVTDASLTSNYEFLGQKLPIFCKNSKIWSCDFECWIHCFRRIFSRWIDWWRSLSSKTSSWLGFLQKLSKMQNLICAVFSAVLQFRFRILWWNLEHGMTVPLDDSLMSYKCFLEPLPVDPTLWLLIKNTSENWVWII